MEDLAALGTCRKVTAGQVLFHEGDSSDEVYVVLTGRFKVSTTSASGRETVLAVRHQGELLGEPPAE